MSVRVAHEIEPSPSVRRKRSERGETLYAQDLADVQAARLFEAQAEESLLRVGELREALSAIVNAKKRKQDGTRGLRQEAMRKVVKQSKNRAKSVVRAQGLFGAADERYWTMVARHEAMIVRRAQKHARKSPDLGMADIVQILKIGWYRAALRFEPSEGVAFPTYAMRWGDATLQRQNDIQNTVAMKPNMSKTGWDRARTSSLDAPLGEDEDGPTGLDAVADASVDIEGEVDRRIQEAKIAARLPDLTSRERVVFLERCKGSTLSEVGLELGVCRERVRQIEKRVVRKLVGEVDSTEADVEDGEGDAPTPSAAVPSREENVPDVATRVATCIRSSRARPTVALALPTENAANERAPVGAAAEDAPAVSADPAPAAVVDEAPVVKDPRTCVWHAGCSHRRYCRGLCKTHYLKAYHAKKLDVWGIPATHTGGRKQKTALPEPPPDVDNTVEAVSHVDVEPPVVAEPAIVVPEAVADRVVVEAPAPVVEAGVPAPAIRADTIVSEVAVESSVVASSVVEEEPQILADVLPPSAIVDAALCRWPDGCAAAAVCRGLCRTHYNRAYAQGILDQVALPPKKSVPWTRTPKKVVVASPDGVPPMADAVYAGEVVVQPPPSPLPEPVPIVVEVRSKRSGSRTVASRPDAYRFEAEDDVALRGRPRGLSPVEAIDWPTCPAVGFADAEKMDPRERAWRMNHLRWRLFFGELVERLDVGAEDPRPGRLDLGLLDRMRGVELVDGEGRPLLRLQKPTTWNADVDAGDWTAVDEAWERFGSELREVLLRLFHRIAFGE